MSKVYIRLLAVAATLIAVTGAAFSIIGLAKLFAGAALAVMVMAGALEFAKLVVTGFLYRYWGHIHRPMRAYLMFAVVTLVGITSVGIFGFLSHAYQVSAQGMKVNEIKMQSLTSENERINREISDIQNFIQAIPPSRISRKFEFQKEYDPKIRELRGRSEEIQTQIESVRVEMLQTHTKIGPAIYLAQSLGWDVDKTVKYLILVFVLVFDPLAVCLVFCLNLAIRLREKYRGNEVRIGAHSFTTPVDHRFSKKPAKLKRVA